MSRRIAVLGDERARVIESLEARGWEVVSARPDVVFSHGGDGTLLRSERTWPGIPKVPARIEDRNRLCRRHRLAPVLDGLDRGRLAAERLPKIEVAVGGWRALAVNDVVLRNAYPTIAVRFALRLGGLSTGEITGDGLIVSTAFGSTAYYRSVCGRTFERGTGAAFMNCTEPRDPIVWEGTEVLEVEVLRGPALLVHDNDARHVALRTGQGFRVSASSACAEVLGLDALRCQECRRSDGSPFNPH